MENYLSGNLCVVIEGISLQSHLMTKMSHEGTWDLLGCAYIVKYLQSMNLFSDLMPSSTDLPHSHLLVLGPMSVLNLVLFPSSKWCYVLCVGVFFIQNAVLKPTALGFFHSTILEMCVTCQGVSSEGIECIWDWKAFGINKEVWVKVQSWKFHLLGMVLGHALSTNHAKTMSQGKLVTIRD